MAPATGPFILQFLAASPFPVVLRGAYYGSLSFIWTLLLSLLHDS